MHRMLPTGLKSRHILPKTVRDCLSAGPKLPYNWAEKLQGAVLAVALSRSTQLQSIARAQGGRVRTREKSLSNWLSRPRLRLNAVHRSFILQTLRRIGRRGLWLHRGKAVLIADPTSYAKLRSRGKVRPMPCRGKVRLHNVPTEETVLAPGYQEIWTGILLKGRTCLGITRRLFSEGHPDFRSQNALEELEIRAAVELIQEALGLKVILVADRGFGRKELLEWLKKDYGVDFLIRVTGSFTVEAEGWRGVLQRLAPYWPRRLQLFWREQKKAILSAVGAARIRLPLTKRSSMSLNAICLTPLNRKLEPMLLVTSLPIGSLTDLRRLVRMYSSRWAIETFFLQFKQSLGAGQFRVFSCWEAIDRLLAIAHMAFVALHAVYELCRKRGAPSTKALRQRLERLAYFYCARVFEWTLGAFFELLARDFLSTQLADAYL